MMQDAGAAHAGPVVILEGGYNLSSISASMAMCAHALLGGALPPLPVARRSAGQLHDAAVATLRRVIEVQRTVPHWAAVLHEPDSFHLPRAMFTGRAAAGSVSSADSLDDSIAKTRPRRSALATPGKAAPAPQTAPHPGPRHVSLQHASQMPSAPSTPMAARPGNRTLPGQPRISSSPARTVSTPARNSRTPQRPATTAADHAMALSPVPAATDHAPPPAASPSPVPVSLSLSLSSLSLASSPLTSASSPPPSQQTEMAAQVLTHDLSAAAP